MSTSTQTSCYVMVILGWGWVGWGNNVHVNLHRHVMLRYGDLLLHLLTHVMLHCGDLLLHLLTHVMLRYGYPGVGFGGVGWGNNVHVNLHSHVMLRYVGQKRSCQPAHTRHATLWLSRLTPHRFLEELCKAVKAMKRF